ncbi:MAG: universal stress protein [Saprospiraceae bacterium]
MDAGINKILCALDFCAASRNALRFAMQLADAYQAELSLLHVMEPIPDAVIDVPQSMSAINRKLLDDTRDRLRNMADEVLDEIGEELVNTPVLTSEVAIGPIGMTVNDEADEQQIDLILIGTNGAAAKPWWMTSVAADVIDHPHVPVLVVPVEAAYRPLHRISFATDLRQADVLHLLKLSEYLQPMTPEIRCLHIVADERERKEVDLDEMIHVFKDKLTGIPITFHQSEEDDVTEALEAFNLMYHVDMQVLVRPRRNFFSELFHVSQSKKTAGYTHIPLLVWPG